MTDLLQVDVERFQPLKVYEGHLIHGFVRRVPSLDVASDRETALEKLAGIHRVALVADGLGKRVLMTVKQVHGGEVIVVDETTDSGGQLEADGMIAGSTEVVIGIYVADCCPVFLYAPEEQCFGLVHSGRKGTELDIAGAAIRSMRSRWMGVSSPLIAVLGPCIRPPHYELDFAADIARQCHAAGATEVYDEGVCTACHVDRYYSYRLEKGRTGRMLAYMALK